MGWIVLHPKQPPGNAVYGPFVDKEDAKLIAALLGPPCIIGNRKGLGVK